MSEEKKYIINLTHHINETLMKDIDRKVNEVNEILMKLEEKLLLGGLQTEALIKLSVAVENEMIRRKLI